MHIRQLISMTTEEIKNLPMAWVKVESDVGSKYFNPRELELSSLFWGCIRPAPANVPIGLDIIIDSDELSIKHILDVQSAVIMVSRDSAIAANDERSAEAEGIAAYRGAMDLYNYAVINLSRYVSSSSIFDYIEVSRNKEIKAIRESVLPTEVSITDGYKKCQNVIRNSPELKNNKLSMYVRNGLVQEKQIMQCVYNIGFRTDIDNRIFSLPCLDGYLHGIRNLNDSMAESRTSSMSLLLSENPLQDTEYLNRRVDQHTMYVRQLVPGDCGNRTLMEVPFVMVKNHFKSLLGQEIILNDKRVFLRNHHRKEILAKEEPILMRSLLHCKNNDPSNVCMACYGDLGHSYPRFSNIGHIAETSIGSSNAQNVLSFKHYVGSAEVSEIRLDAFNQRFLVALKSNRGIKFNISTLRNKRFKVVVKADDAKNIGDIRQIDIDKLDIFRITTLNTINIEVYDKQGKLVEEMPVSMKFGSRNASFSSEALTYLKSKPWGFTDKGNYVMDFSDWNFDNEVFTLPMKHDSPMEYIGALAKTLISGKRSAKGKKSMDGSDKDEAAITKAIEAMTRYRGVDLKPLCAHETKEDAMLSLFALTNITGKLNIVHCAVIVKAYLNKSPTDKNMPRGDEPYVIGTFSDNMKFRSMGPQMSFQNQVAPFLEANNYTSPLPDGNPLDQFLEG